MTAHAARRQRGAWAEMRACVFLRDRGLRPVARNYRCRRGEIDLILRDGDVLVFAEVRYRGPGAWVSGAESVSPAKQARIIASAEHFLLTHRDQADRPCRFDVVTIDGAPPAAEVRWIKDAFQS